MTEAWYPSGAAMIIGATGGLGAAVARALAASGSDIAICYRSREARAAELADELRALGRNVSTHTSDVTDVASMETARDAAIAAHGRIHTLVWAAGPLVSQLLLAETPAAQLRHAVDVELYGFFNTVQLMLPHFRVREGGSFVHLGSAGDLLWPARDGLSVVPKAANEALIKGIAREEGQFNIRANSVLVGVIDAGMFHELLARGDFNEDWVRETQKALALKRWGKAEDIGHAVSFLASNRADYVTGQQLAVAGGYGV